MSTQRQEQKKRSRIKNDITTIQLSNALKRRIKRIQKWHTFDKQDEALDEIISFYEDKHHEIKFYENDDE